MIESWDVSGLQELEKALNDIGEKAGLRTLRKASREAMGGVQFAMAMGAGYDNESIDGEHMRDSIKITTKKLDSKHGGKNNALTTRVGPSKKHSQKAIAQEYGTQKQVAEPFIRPALFENRHRVVSTFRTVLAIEIQKAIKKQAK
ncbi:MULTISPECIES: HK97-gp10 family putative phage morphogenesis protein [unclassified Vibrio]|uniref:HK97-gp10 family putative phage morphogenesis protein n=1 Tax=unclassified Vibrio TaxID=2614977 RepID=UPI00192A02D5|nr:MULTISPECIES: HK97-gp10 family putative phage morphogenesis protein [unclassified Vibrio]